MERKVYEEALRKVVDWLKGQAGVQAIYQIGHVSQPGISDIDMVVVFEDKATCEVSPVRSLQGNLRYPFTHSLFGGSVAHLQRIQEFSFYHNYQLVWGEDVLSSGSASTHVPSQEKLLKEQVAMEFLIANYISRTIYQREQQFDVRSVMLGVNAIKYDLEYLEIKEGALFDTVMQIPTWRANWFEAMPSDKELVDWLEAFYEALEKYLQSWFEQSAFYAPKWANWRMASHIELVNAPVFKYERTGVNLMPVLQLLGKKASKVQKRISKYAFHFPITHLPKDPILEQRYDTYRAYKAYNKQYLPVFSPLVSGFVLNLV